MLEYPILQLVKAPSIKHKTGNKTIHQTTNNTDWKSVIVLPNYRDRILAWPNTSIHRHYIKKANWMIL